MKFAISFIFLFSANAYAVTNCELFDNVELANLTGSMVPNCLTEDNLYSEMESRAASSADGGAICSTCKDSLNSRISISNDDKKRLRKQAYIETMYREYKKTMSVLVTDLVSMRKLYSTGSNYQNAQTKCSAQNFEKKIQSCGSFAKEFLKNSNLAKEISNELASLMSSQNLTPSLLARTENKCSISDQSIISLKPLLLERIITPQIVQTISKLKISDVDNLWQQIAALPAPFPDLIKQHPILKTLSANPADFLGVFKSIANSGSGQTFEHTFRNVLYTSANGNKIDNSIGSKCEQAVDNLTSKICSPDFEQGNISLGPIDGFERYNNDNSLPDDGHVNNEALLAKNFTLLEFCNSSPSKLSLAKDSTKINEWMSSNDRQSTYNSYASTKYRESFGNPKDSLCNDISSKRCESNQNSNDANCQLLNLYNESLRPGSISHTLANNPDPKLNNVFRSMVGNPQGISPQTRDVLIAEGIIPQANGQFVEREVPRERQPEYLAGVADGSITPSSTSSTTPPVLAQAPINRQQRPQQQAQPAIFQPQVANSAAPETQVAANTTDDDQDDLRRFQDGLEERRRRAEGTQENRIRPQQQAQTNRRAVSRQDSSERSENSLPTADIAPIAQPQAQAQAFNNAVPNSTPGTASLGRDTSRRGLADRQRQAALADMDRKNQPQASGEAGRSPASVEGQQTNSESKVALTISGDIRANLERVLQSSGADGVNLRSLIQNKRTFKFELNNSIFDVQFNNNGYVVRPSSNPNARTLQEVFNDSLRTISERTPANQRTATLPDLNRDLENRGRN